ncbi:hypothetical protein O181_067079 [Austropuccinia psidii MF-1]|uniref:Reverse transcriptase domain-containing protein n=1 Tax=Austropuccinia psidii MF-1 TaxID=1389203 RepID=A0A9Q3I659_9BASI|nr:hypothetical protein [Austropuccinia psidii MF-1]
MKADKLPPHHACDHHIKLEGSLPPAGVIYFLSNQESDTLRAYISENVEKGFIQTSSSSTGAPVLFVKKEDRGLHLCFDYSKLNAVTRKNNYPVPPMNQILTLFNGSSIFSNIDLCGAYNLLRIKEGAKHLTCFRTKYGNDIIVFSKSEEEHVTYVSTVLARLRANNLFAKASKFLFNVSSLEYLNYIVSAEGLKMDQEKVQQILNWPPPINLKALQSLLGFANFYSHFINNYLRKISSLTSFPKKDSHFPLNEEALKQFN